MTGGRVTARRSTNEVRDHMWLARNTQSIWGPGWKTNREVYEEVTQERSTSTQSIRRSLNWLVEQGLLEKDNQHEPEIFRWNPARPFPGTPPSQPQKPAPGAGGVQPGNPVLTAGAGTGATSKDPKTRQQELHEILEARMAETLGKKEKKAPDKKPPRRGIIRKNGQVYMPRSVGGYDISDVDYLRELRAAGKFPLLYGPPGTGKSVLPEAAFADELVIFEGHEDSSVDDLVGGFYQYQNTWVWFDGPALIAAKQGRPLFLDDMTLVSPKVLAVLYPLMDGRREIWVPQHILKQEEIDAQGLNQKPGEPEHVMAKEGFWVIGAHNPGVHGAILTDALRSRFTVPIEVETDLELAAELKVPEKFIRLARNMRTKKKNNDVQWTPQLRELLAAKDIVTIFSGKLNDKAKAEAMAAGNLVGVVPEEDRDIVLDTVRSIFGTDIKPLHLAGQI